MSSRNFEVHKAFSNSSLWSDSRFMQEVLIKKTTTGWGHFITTQKAFIYWWSNQTVITYSILLRFSRILRQIVYICFSGQLHFTQTLSPGFWILGCNGSDWTCFKKLLVGVPCHIINECAQLQIFEMAMWVIFPKGINNSFSLRYQLSIINLLHPSIFSLICNYLSVS